MIEPKLEDLSDSDKFVNDTEEKLDWEMPHVVNVLGQPYSIRYLPGEHDAFEDRTLSGVVNLVDKIIYISTDLVTDVLSEDKQITPAGVRERIGQVIRHEMVHAFLYESGLNTECDWANSEEMVDWLALKIGKISDEMHLAGVL